MASLTQWTWVWVNSRSCWWTGRPGMLQSMGLQTVGHDWVTELNWTEDSILGFGMQAFLYKGKIEIFLLEFSSPPMQDRERVTYRGALQDPGCGEPNPHLLISLIHCLNPRVRQSGSRAWWPISGSLLTYLKFVNWEETLCDISPVRTVSNFNFFTCQESLDFGIFIISFINSLIVVVGAFFCLKIEEHVGSYVCKHCGCHHKPSFKKIFWAIHFGRTRYLSCPMCEKMSWQKKEI